MIEAVTSEIAEQIRRKVGTPCYLYLESELKRSALAVKAFPHAFGFKSRFAAKALSNAAILRRLQGWGLAFDASSEYELRRLVAAGIPVAEISLSSQEIRLSAFEWIKKGAEFNACSLRQLRLYLEDAGLRAPVGLRFNPGMGSGSTQRTNTGGPASSFGIWHEYLPEAAALAARYGVTVSRIHTHIGSGADTEVWIRCADLSLDLARRLPEVTTVNLGGGFKVGRMPGEATADLQPIGEAMADRFRQFERETGRALNLEIEPGTYIAANCGLLLTTVVDVVDTGQSGFVFAKTDTGMTEILRPSHYGAEHPIWKVGTAGNGGPEESYVIVGHCCESGDILTTQAGDPEALATRLLPRLEVGDTLAIGGAGAYCASMAASHYNSFPRAPEVLLSEEGDLLLIRQREPAEAVYAWETETAI